MDKFTDSINNYLRKYYMPEVLTNELLAQIPSNEEDLPEGKSEFQNNSEQPSD